MKRHIIRVILIAGVMAFSASTQAMDPALLRAVGGVLDVTREPYSADNTGKTDATDAIRRAMHDASRRTLGIFTTTDRAVQIVYLPDGVYRISAPLVFDTPAILAARPRPRDEVGLRYVSGHMMLVGQSRDGTVLKVADGCPAFQQRGASVVRMTSVKWTNQGYWNSVADLTIDVGRGNPGATALWFVSNNLGTIREVRLLCRDDENPAELGLDLTAGAGGLGYLYDLEILGFRTGIRAADYHVGYTLEKVRLQGQHELGIDNTDKNLYIRHLVSDNRVPVLHNRTAQGQVVLLDSDLRGGAAESSAILNAGPMFLRNVRAEGYKQILPDRDGKELGECVVGTVCALWPEAPRQSLGLEIKDTPQVPWDRPEAWRIFDPSLQDDDTAALQAALDSGAETVVIKSDVGRVRLTDTVHLRGNVRRLHGGWCNLDVSFAGEPRPLFQIETGAHPVLIVEAMSNGQRVHGFDTIVNDSDKTVVLKDLFLDYGRSNYRNHGRGDLFLESVVSGGGDFDHLGMRPTPGWLIRNQRVWARNLNPEAYAPDLQVEGGSFWCLGAKLGEIYGPYIEIGGGARVEMLGAVLNTCPPSLWKPDRKGYAIRTVDSEVSFVGVDRIRPGAGEGPNPVQIIEERGGERRELLHRDLPRRIINPSPADALSVAIPLYRSAAPQKPATAAAARAPQDAILAADASPSSKPNILFALADDWSYGHAGSYGCTWVKTPAMDRVAREGLLFTHAYTPCGKCAPSRASILTGRNPWQLKAAANHWCTFPPEFRTFPEALGELGYFTGMTGKGWGPGVAKDVGGKDRQMTGRAFTKRQATPPTAEIAGNDYAANFSDFLDAAPKEGPWCFWYGGHEPHRRYEFGSGIAKGGKRLADIDRVPACWPDNDAVRNDMLDYAFEVEHFDRHLGRMLAELEKRGLLDNTLVVVTSDNGMPFPHDKGYAYNDSDHLPLAVMWKKGIRNPGRVVDDYMSFIDFAPTFMDVAGVAWKPTGMAEATGRSLTELFTSEKSGRVIAERDHVLIGKERNDVGRPNDWGYPIRGIVKGDLLYLHNFEAARWPGGNPETGYLDTDGSPTKTEVLKSRLVPAEKHLWDACFGMRPADELYDLRRDPDCVSNCAANVSFDGLKRQLFDELKRQDDPRLTGNSAVFDTYPCANAADRGFYEKYMRSEKVKAGWAEKSDFERTPLK